MTMTMTMYAESDTFSASFPVDCQHSAIVIATSTFPTRHAQHFQHCCSRHRHRHISDAER